MSLVAVDCHMAGLRVAGDAGNARYAVSLAEALGAGTEAGGSVVALVAGAEGERALAGRVERTARVPAGDLRRLGAAAPRALRALGAGAAVFTYISPAWSPCPLLLAVHDASFITRPEWLGPRARALLRAMVPRSARRAARVLALSHTAADEIGAALGLDPERVAVVSPYPDPVFSPAAGAPARVAERFGLSRYCLAVGDLGPRKNLAALGQAVRMLRGHDLELALVGRPGRDGAAIAAAAGGRWLGYVDDATLADLYRAAAVTAFPSLHEGFGLPALEAMACASPVVASDRGALPEVTGGAALLAAPTPGGLAEGLRAALEPALAERLRAAGPGRAAHYTRERMGAAAWAAVRGATT